MSGHWAFITGGREYYESAVVADALNDHFEKWAAMSDGPMFLVHGAATGADTLAQEWSEKTTLRVTTIQLPAWWGRWKHGAGPIRNGKMVAMATRLRDIGESVVVIAFPGGNGTANMKKQSLAAGLGVWEPTK